MKKWEDLEKQVISDVAAMAAGAARTAPKTRGIDNIEIISIDDEPTRKKLIAKMEDLAKANDRPSIARDAISIAASRTVILIGVRSNPAGLNCGFCGYRTCEELKKTTGICAYNSIDLGIALSSAASIANQFHMDNRLMYSIGLASIKLGLLGKDIKLALGIPLSATGKNPFFDRK